MPLPLQLLEGGDRLLERMAAAPVQEVAVEPVGLQPLERPLAGGDRSVARGVLRQHLGDEEDLVAPPGDRLADDLLGRARAVELGGVDVGHAEVEAAAERADDRGALAPLDVPGALADDRHVVPAEAATVRLSDRAASCRASAVNAVGRAASARRSGA